MGQGGDALYQVGHLGASLAILGVCTIIRSRPHGFTLAFWPKILITLIGNADSENYHTIGVFGASPASLKCCTLICSRPHASTLVVCPMSWT